jgi:putative ABC transport system permease protein
VIRLAWRSLLARKLRTVLTLLAILLGVAMISGTYVLTDQIDRGFEQIFTDAYEGVDVTITRKAAFGTDTTGISEGLPAAMIREVREVEGVALAEGYVAGVGAVAIDGEVVQTGGAPTLFFSYTPTAVGTTTYVEGGPPEQPGDIGIIQKLAGDEDLGVGAPITVITDQGSFQARVSGVFRFGAESSLGGSLILQPGQADAEQWFDMEGRVSEIDVRATAGTSAETLAQRIDEVLPPEADVKTAAQAAADQTRQISEAIGTFLTPALLSFGGVAVLVGAFIIFNAFSMTVAQRRREFAMLRALGASRRQVLLVIAGEALVMGLFASLAGLFAGLGVAALLNQLFLAVGADIPRSGLVLQPRTIAVALSVGIVVTLLSALIPAVRATRVPPVSALQEGAELPPSRFARFTPYFAAASIVVGAAFLVWGMYGGSGTTTRLAQIALGAVLIFLAVAMLSKYFVRPVAGVLGWPLQRLSPVSGRLARDNTQRNPGRTAATAAALMIGLGVVVFVAVFAQGLKSSFIDRFDRTVDADYVVTGENFLSIPSTVERTVQGVPSIEVASGIQGQQVQLNGDARVVYAVDPRTFSDVWRFDWVGDADDTVLDELGSEGIIVEEEAASGLGVDVGQRVDVLTADGAEARLRVLALYRDPIILNGAVISSSAYRALVSRPQLFLVVARSAGGATEATTRALDEALAQVPTANVQTSEEYKDSVVAQVNQLLTLLYVLLAMSVLISLFGIVNTLVLAVYERTREIGMLRAIGTSRAQVRGTVRYESVITSIIGAALGIAVGIAFAYVVTSRFGGFGITFSIPWTQLGIFLAIAVVVGVLAAILPARRAARVDILQAIHYE